MNRRISKRNIFLYVKLILYIVFSGFILFISNNVVCDIIAFVILVFGSISVVKCDLAHPYVWYSFVFMLYSISYPILYINNMTYDVYTYTKSLMFSQWLALVIFLLVVTPAKTDYSKLKETKTNIIPSKIFLIISSLVLVITIFEILTGGYSHKSEIYESGSILVFIGFRVVLIFLIIYAINLSIYALKENRIDRQMTTYVFIIVFLMFFFSGERDLIIRFFIILYFIYYVLIKKSKLSKEVFLLGLFSLCLIPILSKYKYFGLTGEKTSTDMNFFFKFLTSDFASASKNMQILLLDEGAKGRFSGYTFLSAILRVFGLEKLPRVEMISSLQWFNDTYFGPARAGQGFTIVGDGYVNFGYIGIALLFAFIGIIVKKLYSKSNKGVYYFVFYILSIPIFMYSIRADLANILVPLIKQNLLIILLFRFIIEILYNSKEPHKID